MPDGTPPQITTNTPIGEGVDLDQEHVRLSDGGRVTDETAEDVVEQLGRSSRRPSLSGEKNSSPQIAFRVPSNMRDKAEQDAADEHKTVSQLVREALEERLNTSGRWLVIS